MNNTIEISLIKNAWEILHNFNKIDLESIRFVHNGIEKSFDKEKIKEFQTFGLNNVDFFTCGIAYDWITKEIK